MCKPPINTGIVQASHSSAFKKHNFFHIYRAPTSRINQVEYMAPYIFYEPFYSEIERLLNDPSILRQDRKGCDVAPVVKSFKPRLDLHEDAEKNVVTATFEFPGFSKDEVEISVQSGKLTVSAETKKSKHNADTGYTFNERLHGKFSRTLQLPQGVQGEQIKATMEDGLLTITFPKTLPELAPKKIVIQTSDKKD